MIGKKISKTELFLDRLNRHGLYYLIKTIETTEAPKIVINSFWRSGSTHLLELTANVLQMRPYFEPITPIEPRFDFLYADINAEFPLDRWHPTLTEKNKGNFNQAINQCKFDAKWVYQNANVNNAFAKNGKVMKLVTGAHVLDQFDRAHTKVYHLEREIEEVVESFYNSKWTLKFLNRVDLSDYLVSENVQEAEFYKRVYPFLNLQDFKFHEAITIYKTLTDSYVRKNNPNAEVIYYHDLRQNSEQLMTELASGMGQNLDIDKLNSWMKKPSRMTVFSSEKRKLSVTEKAEIHAIIAELKIRLNQP